MEVGDYVGIGGRDKWVDLKGEIGYGGFSDEKWEEDLRWIGKGYRIDVV